MHSKRVVGSGTTNERESRFYATEHDLDYGPTRTGNADSIREPIFHCSREPEPATTPRTLLRSQAVASGIFRSQRVLAG
ncbi:MAG: hypothetical protein ABGZ35_16220, partial [Planctomycetaceae bacterium]